MISVISLFVCLLYLGMAKRICAIFTVKTCLIPRSDVFEYQGQRSKVKLTRDKNALSAADTPVRSNGMRSLKNSVQQQRTGLFPGCQGVFSGACVRCVFGETSLALVSCYCYNCHRFELKHAMLCYVMLCYAVLCHNVIC